MKKTILIFTTAILSFIVPLPSRFAYTIIMLFAVNFVMLSGTALKMFIGKLNLANLEGVLMIVFMLSMTILFKQFVILFSPVIAFTIGFVIYLAPASSFLTGHILEPKEKYSGNLFAVNMRNSGILSGVAVLVSIVREFLAYGSFSLPFHDGIHMEQRIIETFDDSFLQKVTEAFIENGGAEKFLATSDKVFTTTYKKAGDTSHDLNSMLSIISLFVLFVILLTLRLIKGCKK